MKKILSAAIAVLCAGTALAQSPYLVRDINTSYAPNAVSSSPRSFVAAGSTTLFAAASDAAGFELFRTDGNTIELVKDIVPGTGGSISSSLFSLSPTTIVFGAYDPVHGAELWKSDGTDAGTVIVKDIYPGAQSSGVYPVAVMGDRVFLVASDTNQTAVTWVTDGTESGTMKLADAPAPNGFVVLNNFMFFYSGSTLWRSDGTPAGTTAVRTDLTIAAMSAAGGHLFLAAWDSAHGYELWMSDGTAGGTVLLKDINPGAASAFNSSYQVSLAPVGSTIVFFAYEPVNGWSLWRSDGTANGTFAFRTYSPSATLIPPFLTSAHGLAYFSSGGIWRTDGTEQGTIRLGAATNLIALTASDSNVFALGRDSQNVIRLWSTDGTDIGTTLVSTTAQGGSPYQLSWVAGKLFFCGFDASSGSEPWVSDGTENGTHQIANMVSDPPASSNPGLLRGADSRLFFTATNGAPIELWTSDGTSPGTLALTNFQGTRSVYQSAAWNDGLFFTTGSLPGLYYSDGTAAGTAQLKDMQVASFFPSSSYMYMAAPPVASPYYYWSTLWRSDGTVAGTVDLSASMIEKPNAPSNFVEAGGHVYFEAGDSRGIWRTDGTPQSTVRVTTHPTNYASIASPLVAASGYLFYSFNVNQYGQELLRTDPINGDTMVLDLRPGVLSSVPDQLVAAGPLVFFTADNGTNGRELWRSDGTTAGTFMVKDIAPVPNSTTTVRLLTAVGNRLFFVASDSFNGTELWTSDGTTAGTNIVADIAPGAASSSPDSLVAADGLLWFAADDGSTGRELWKSDGTAAGTLRVADLNPGSAGSNPSQLTVAARRLFFGALTSAGRELWAMPLSPIAYRIANARVTEGTGATSQLHFKVTRIGDVSQASTVAYATSAGTATAGTDFASASGTLTFTPGMHEATIDIDVAGDTEVEDDETLFVTISSPSAGLIESAQGAGLIVDDDGSAALSLVYIQSGGSSLRSFVVTNTGLSSAESVTFHFSVSPTSVELSGTGCTADGYGAVSCSLGTIASGESRTVTINQNSSYSTYSDSTNPPGYTMTASVSTLTAEADLSDNSVVKMTTNDQSMVMPPFLTSSVPATLEYIAPYSYSSSTTVQLTSSNPGVAVTPTYVTIPANERHATFTLQPGADITGKTKLSINYSAMTVPIVAPGSTPKLDPTFSMSLPYSIKYGKDMEINARVAARKADGTYPTGLVSLLDELNATMDQFPVDATGSVKVVEKNLPVGQFTFSLRYEGDANFAPLQVPFTFRVDPYSTSINLLTSPVICGNTAEVTVIVSTTDTTDAPTGSVRISTGSGNVQATLSPTGKNGVAQATAQIAVNASVYSIGATYTPTGPFAPGYQTSKSVSVGCDTTINLTAVATATNRVVLNWTGSAPTYEVYRYSTDGYYYSWYFIGYAGTTTYLDTNAQFGRSYLYRVRPTGGNTFSAPDLATTMMFTDDPIVPMSTRIKALHFSELLNAVNSVRQLAGFSAGSFTTAPDFLGKIRPSSIAELRANLAEGLRWLGMPPVNYTDAVITAGAPVKAAHIQELRNAVK